jgi:nicotinamidase-related amidase
VVVDLDEHSCARCEDDERLYGPVNAVAAAVRRSGGTVAFVTSAIAGPEALSGSLGAELAAVYYDATVSGAARRLAAGLDVQADDLRVEKARASAFFPGNCDLHERLRARGVEHVLIGGLVTNVCCESSARDACELGYQVTMVSDALVGHQFGLHEAALATFFRIFGDVRPSAEVIGLLAAGATRSGPSRGR